MKRFLICTIVSLPVFFATPASAQSHSGEKIRPQWLHKLPKESNSTFKYTVVSATAATPEQARKDCTATLFNDESMRNGVAIISDYNNKEKLYQVWNNGKLTEQIEYDATTTTSVHGAEIQMYAEKKAEYGAYDKYGNYVLNILYAKSNPGQIPQFDDIDLTTKYGARGLWRSAIIPGWGQFHKGSYLKGGLMLGGCAVLAAGIIFTENQRTDYIQKIGKTHDANLKRAYATKRDHFATGRNICIGAVAALYVYNLIDAIVAPGAQRVVVRPRNSRVGSYAFAPAILSDGAPGLAAAITF